MIPIHFQLGKAKGVDIGVEDNYNPVKTPKTKQSRYVKHTHPVIL
jgi:hypothetical protein